MKIRIAIIAACVSALIPGVVLAQGQSVQPAAKRIGSGAPSISDQASGGSRSRKAGDVNPDKDGRRKHNYIGTVTLVR
jgi:hypothetical protein